MSGTPPPPPPPGYGNAAYSTNYFPFPGVPDGAQFQPFQHGYGEPYEGPMAPPHGHPRPPAPPPPPDAFQWNTYAPTPSSQPGYWHPFPPSNHINIHCHGSGAPGQVYLSGPGAWYAHAPPFWPTGPLPPPPYAAAPPPGWPGPPAPPGPAEDEEPAEPRKPGAAPPIPWGGAQLHAGPQTLLHVVKPMGTKPWEAGQAGKQFAFRVLAVASSTSVAELAAALGARREQSVTEMTEAGGGRWRKGRTVKGSDKDADTTRIDAVGLGRRGMEEPKWIAVHD